MWGSLSAGMSSPRFVTVSTARLPCRAASSWMGVPGAAYFTALSSSTASACPSLAPSPRADRPGAMSYSSRCPASKATGSNRRAAVTAISDTSAVVSGRAPALFWARNRVSMSSTSERMRRLSA